MSPEGRRPLLERLHLPVIRPEGAQLAGWAALAAVSVITTHIAPAHDLGPAAAAIRDAMVAGHLVAAGLVVYAAVALWQRFGPKRRVIAYAAVAVASLAITGPPLREDLANLATKIGLPYEIARALLTFLVALAVPIAALFGRILARRRLGAAGALGAVAIAAANHFVLPDDYSGMHLVAAITAATLFGAALATAGAPPRPGGRWVLGACALIGASAMLVRPPGSVRLAVLRVPGDVVARWIARLRQGDETAVGARDLGAVLAPAQAAWWQSRLGRPPIPASTPPLVRRDAIVMLIVVDCLRADVLESDAHARRLPSMFALRDAGVDFTRARATATATTQSVTAIFTGRYYSQLYWKPRPNWNAEAMYPDADPTPRFTELLVPAGVQTATISGMPGLTKQFGIVKGFQEERLIQGSRGFAHASQIMPPVIARLAAQGPGPLFLYVHFTDAHAPYDHASNKGKPFDRYLRGLGHVDREIGALIARIDADPALRERVTIMLTADHGEAFGEHGSQYHATTIYEELLRVPFVVRVPGAAPRRVATPVSLVDVAPTILDLFGVETPGEMMGESLVPFLRGRDPSPTRPIIADSSRLQRAVIFPDGHKIIHDRRRGTVELYDLERDPREIDDLFDRSGPAGVLRLHALKAFFEAHTLKRPGYRVPYGR